MKRCCETWSPAWNGGLKFDQLLSWFFRGDDSAPKEGKWFLNLWMAQCNKKLFWNLKTSLAAFQSLEKNLSTQVLFCIETWDARLEMIYLTCDDFLTGDRKDWFGPVRMDKKWTLKLMDPEMGWKFGWTCRPWIGLW